MAQRKHFPSLDWNKSYTKYMRVLDPFFNDNYDPAYSRLKNRCTLDLHATLLPVVMLTIRSLSEPRKSWPCRITYRRSCSWLVENPCLRIRRLVACSKASSRILLLIVIVNA